MLFNRKLSKYISVVLASSAFCSSSLVGAITDADTIIRVKLKYLDKEGGIPDDARNVKLLRYIANNLIIDNDYIMKYKKSESVCFSIFDNSIPIKKVVFEPKSDETRVGTWFRDMMCQCFANLDEEDLKDAIICIYRYYKNRFGGKFKDSMFFKTNNFKEELGIECKGLDIERATQITFNSANFCSILSKICYSFDITEAPNRNNYDTKYWEIMTNFFKSLLFDISKEVLACKLYDSVDIHKICLNHFFILIVDLFKCFGVEKTGKIDLDSVYIKNISSLKGCEDQIDKFLSDCDLQKKTNEIKIPYEQLSQCILEFLKFIYFMVDSLTFYRLISTK